MNREWYSETGCHASTQLALELFEDYFLPGMSVCDVGTGTGVIAIAAAKIGANNVFAFDNDPKAIEYAHKCIAINNVTETVAAEVHEIAAPPDGQFNIVTANINRSILTTYASALTRITISSGYIIMSGLEIGEEESVIHAFETISCTLEKKIERLGWIGLAFQLRGNQS